MLNPEQFFGAGVDSYFPEGGAEVRPVPFPRAGRSKSRRPFSRTAVNDALSQPPQPVEMDPRTFQATQRSVTAPGVRHYESGDWKDTGELYADHDKPVNQYPVLYERTNESGSRVDRLLLSGHHRATADLLEGRNTPVIHVKGGWGTQD